MFVDVHFHLKVLEFTTILSRFYTFVSCIFLLASPPTSLLSYYSYKNIPTSCSISPSMHTTKLSTCTPNKQTGHSLLLTHQTSCIQHQYNVTTYTLTCHTDSALLVRSTASAYKTDRIYHAQ